MGRSRLEHLARVARVIKSPGGNALLAGALRGPVVVMDGHPPIWHMLHISHTGISCKMYICCTLYNIICILPVHSIAHYYTLFYIILYCYTTYTLYTIIHIVTLLYMMIHYDTLLYITRIIHYFTLLYMRILYDRLLYINNYYTLFYIILH